MCIFTGQVEDVKNTSIFARLSSSGHQYLAYEMSASLTQDMAQVLPLNLQVEAPLEFLDLSGCPRLFYWLDKAFVDETATGAL